MSDKIDVLTEIAAAEGGNLTAAYDAVAELLAAAREANEYLGGFSVGVTAVYKTPAQELRDQADAIEKKGRVIARFRAALSRIGHSP